MFKCYHYKDILDKIWKFPPFMSVPINFVIFLPSSLNEVGIRSCRFHVATNPGTPLGFICVAQYSPDHKALTCKRDNYVKSRVSNEQMKAEIMSNSLHLNIGLAQDYCISSALATGIQILGHTIYIWPVDFGKLGSHNGLFPEGNWTLTHLCTFADYSSSKCLHWYQHFNEL